MALAPSPWTAGAKSQPEELQLTAAEEGGEGEDDYLLDSPSSPVALTTEQRLGIQQLSKAEQLDTRSHDILNMTLNKMSFSKPPEIHNTPAPPVIPPQGDPTLLHRRPPTQYTVGVRKSYFERFLNSTVGRCTLFGITLFFINISILGLVSWNHPEYRASGASFYYFFMALFVLLVNYTIPLLAEIGGMSAKETGWKPYLIYYRLSFVVAIPAAVLQVLGTGAETDFGTSAGPAGELKLVDVKNNYWDYFELADGFVALNLTKGITETLAAEEHGVKAHRRFSRFRDSELRVNTEPYSDQPEPTETPGRLATYRIAPIFEKWSICVTRYRISTACLRTNPVKAWAISKSTSMCSRYKSVGCRPPKPSLEPIYKCSKINEETGDYGYPGMDPKLPGLTSKKVLEGVCGHVTLPPPEGAIDELGALLLYDAWPKLSLPKPDQLWIDVNPDPCISTPAECKATWNNYYLGGLVCQVVANLFILIPMFCDCKVDRKIRDARQYLAQAENEKLQGPKNRSGAAPKAKAAPKK